MSMPTLVETSNTAPAASNAQGVLAEAQGLEAAALAAAAEANPPAEPRPPAKLSWDEAIKRAPPAVADLMRGMQSDYTKKTQDLADQRKEIARERESLLKLKFEAPADLGEYDPFDETSVSKRIEAEVARRMSEMLAPMQQEAELLKAESEYTMFVTTYPDFKSDVGIRSEVQRLLEANPNLDLETAYFAAKGKQKGTQASAKSAAERKAAQSAAQAVSSPRKSAAPSLPDKKSVRHMSTAEILAAAQAMHR